MRSKGNLLRTNIFNALQTERPVKKYEEHAPL